jgi:hypothetical protein
MNISRRNVLRMGAAGVAVAAVGGGVAFQNWRAHGGLGSARITGPWPELGNNVQWVLPDLHDAPMVVPDRPHDVGETRDPARRAAVKRTRTFTVNTSSRRLRADTLGPLPAAGKRRFVAIGDSVTFGWGVADDESWPAQLQAELLRRGHDVEILNAGVPAQRLEGMRGWLERVGPTLGLDGVLICRRPYPGAGDPSQIYGETVRAVRAALPRAHVVVLLPPVSQFDPHGTRVWRQEESGLLARLQGTPLLELTPVMRAAQGQRGCRIEVMDGVVTVIRGETGERLLTGATTEFGLPPEVYALLEADASVREALFFDDGHPDRDGFAALVPAIADRIAEEGWFA